MKKIISLLVGVGLSALAAAETRPLQAGTADWPQVGQAVYLIPDSVKRYGNSAIFVLARALPDHPMVDAYWEFETRWAPCHGGWVSSLMAFDVVEDVADAKDAYRRAFAKAPKTSLDPVSVQRFPSEAFGDGTALSEQVGARCAALTPSNEPVSIPIAGLPPQDGKLSYVDFMVLKSVVRQGDLVEAWIDRRPVSRKPVLNRVGTHLGAAEGAPLMLTNLLSRFPAARFKLTADCGHTRLATSQVASFDSSGKAFAEESPPEALSFAEPTPGTIAVRHLDVLCQQ